MAAAPATGPAPPRAPQQEKTATDVLAGALARAGSQSCIHPLDSYKVRLQAKQLPGRQKPPLPGAARGFRVHAAGIQERGYSFWFQKLGSEMATLYKGVFSAAAGAGIIIGTYFAFYSTTKRYLRQNTQLAEGSIAFASGATAAVGSSVVKVPIAVCIRNVQAGVYRNVFHAAKAITAAAGPRGLFTGFLPTMLEDAPDMAVKFAVYETMRAAFRQLHGGREPGTVEDLFMGGLAGAAAAAATTPVDVVKTRMMCSASVRPTIVQAVQSVVADGKGWRSFFKGVGPRALSNGLNSAIFFCFFEAIRRVLNARQQEQALQEALSQQISAQQWREGLSAGAALQAAATASVARQQQQLVMTPHQGAGPAAAGALAAAGAASSRSPVAGRGQRIACLSLAVPLYCLQQR